MKTFIIHFLIAFFGSYIYFEYGEPMFPYNAIWAVVVAVFIMFILWLTTPSYHRSYFHKLPKAISFIVFFLKELVVANLKVAYDILTPNYRMKPTVIALPLAASTDMEITLLSGIITLTPGSLSIDVSADRKVLYIHTLYIKHNDLELAKQTIKHGFERRLLQLTR
ncbi:MULTISPECIES: Na+/H+ antiporter subunit E [Pontibacter]|uniref:Multisubunit sodium/proton antiporter, MrpE subunit n=1 Tax=Pontibacter lucknowensis TaxID=1077936 RepID=A0A1N6WQP7_9BACT|nr:MULTISPECIES: Na+/H+ antiporter subunit E [Pontibacter]EJF07976.1 putative monovalent cation/H+ antiporter subunit E [Pontibacter sp. BAB1700]SIQ92410.1 multisubunit sodium/proton antiporter, MrpE subunit [Pontibacter lucknowensis]